MAELRILVVEDNEDQAELLRRYLERSGCAVTVAATAEDAILRYQEQSPDLAIIDLLLPGMDGWELARRLRSDLPDVAIVITSVLDTADYPKSHASLPKPFTGAQVRSVLDEYLSTWPGR